MLLHSLHRQRKVRLGPFNYRGEMLEERRLLAGQPNVALQLPAQVMLGESFSLTATFDNTHPTDPGYGPFIDLYVPVNGADGVGGVGADGLTFGSAQYLGSPVTTIALTFPDNGGGNGTVVHPYAVDSLGNPLSITGRAGDQLIVMQLPFGSFTASQPPAPITIDMQLSDLADLGQVLNLRSRAGFQFGNTPLNDPASDPSLLSDATPTATSWTTTAAITPTLIALQKIYLGPEDETATGPNFPRQYRIDIDVADQQTITNLDVTDLLPNNVQLVSVDIISPAGSVTTNPTTPANAPNNRLVVTLPSVTGTTAQNDTSVTFTYFVPFRDADAQLTNDSVTGDDATSNNHAAALGDWTPIDLRDSGGTDNASVDIAGPEHVLTPKSLAVQKSVTIVADPNVNGLSAGDTLEYRIDFQVSDFFAFQNLVLDDILSDGQRFDTTFAPTLLITEHGVTSSGNMNSANFSVIDHFTGAASPVAPLDGTQTLLFRASDELALRTGDGVLWGGLVPVGGTGGSDPLSATFNGGGTTGVLVFRSVVQEDFTDTFPSLDSSVDEGDILRNDVTISGDVLNYATGLPTGQSEADNSAAEISVPAGSLTKSIYALNGSNVLPSPLLLAPGDTITYRLVLSIPTSDVENLALSDYLPLPVLAATEISQFDDVVDASIPLAGRAKFGPTDTFRSIYGSIPTLLTDPVSNAVTFDYGDFDTPNGASRVIDILFTVTASDEPFADGLFLTNMARRSQDTTNAADFVTDAIVQVELAMPELRLSKGIVATDNPAAQFTASVGPVTFTAPGSAGFRASSTVHSNGLTATPINANVQNLDAGDLVTFAVIVENTGRSRAGAFDIRLQDTLPAGFTTPSGGLNLTITDGTGAPLTTVDLGGGLFAAGIEVVDPGATPGQPDLTDAGALDEYDATDGRNILILTYDLEVTGTVTPNSALTNTATLFHYAGAEGGTDFTTTDLTDPATAQVAAIDVSKTISTTDQPSTTGNNVAIGEVITYTSILTIPEGIANNVQWVDVPDTGLSVVELVSITPSLALTTSVGTFTDVRNAAILATNGDSLTLNFQTLTNSDRDDATAETITIVYRVVTLNSATNNRGTLLNNLATVTWTGGTDTVSAPNATVVEPEVNVTKTIVPATGQASDQFIVSISLQHTVASNADAFDLSLSDILPTGLTFVGGLTSSGTAPTSLTQSGNTISATWNTLPLSSTSTIEFTVQLDGSVQPGQVINNSATSTWTSLPTSVLTPISSDPISTERTGATGNPGGSVNDYADVGSASVTVATPAFTKSVIGTNQPSSTGNSVVIGEIVTYRATIAIPQSTLSSVQFIDTPAVGLAIVDVQTVTASSGISSTLGTMATIAANATLPADGSTLTLNFGTLTNSDSDSNTTETITIEYRAIVLNTGTNDRGDVLDNSASFLWGTSNSLTTTGDDLTIIEPAIQISKSLSPTTGQAADTIRVTVNMSHNVASNADTFNVTINDVLPAGMTFLGNLSSTGGLAPSTLTQSAGTISGTWDSFPLGSTTQFQFDVALTSSVQIGTSFDNLVNVRWSSLPGNQTTPQSSHPLSTERTGSTLDPGGAANDYNTNAAATVNIAPPTLAKTLTASDQTHSTSPEVVIGEIVTYQTRVTLPQGTASAAQLLDTASAGLAIVDLLSVTASPDVTSSLGTMSVVAAGVVVAPDGSGFSLNLGNLVNSNTDPLTTESIVVTYRAIVMNTPNNNSGTNLANQADFRWNSTGSLTEVAPNLLIVEPLMQVSVSNATPPSADAGDVVTFSIDVSHALASGVDAQNVSLQNLINSAGNHLQYVPGSLAITTTGAPVLETASDAGGNLAISWSEFPRGSTATITFQAVIQTTAPPFTQLINAAELAWTSVAGDRTTPQTSQALSVERTGNPSQPGGSANDHLAQDTGFVLTASPEALKSVVSTSLINTGTSRFNNALPDVAVGEQVTYRIQASLPEGTSTVGILDQLPAPLGTLEFVDVRVVSIGSNLTIANGRPLEFRNDTDLDNIDDLVTLDFGTVINTPDGTSDGRDMIEIEVTARVLDLPDNINGTVLTNTAFVDFGIDRVTATSDIDVVEPVLQIAKVANPTSGPAGTTVTYTLVVSHTSGSTSDAFDLAISDSLLDANLSLVPGSVTTSAGTIATGNSAGDTSVLVNVSTLASTNSITVTFQAVIQPALLNGVSVNNTSSVTWDSLPGVGGRTNNHTDPATFSTTAPEIDLEVSKVDLPDPVTIGGRLVYTILVTNHGPSTATNVVVTDVLPASLTIDGITTSQGTTSVLGTTLTALLGTMAPGEQVTIDVETTAPATPQSLSNVVSVTASQQDTDVSNNTFTQPTTVVLTSTLSGRNWVDTDADNVFDGSEVPLPGVQLTLTGTNDLGQSVTLQTTSAADGTYAFTGLRPGTYQVTQTQPTFFIDAADYVGTAGGTVSSNDQLRVTLTPGTDAEQYNFTELGLRSNAFSKRMFLLSSLSSAGNPTNAINNSLLDTLFAQLARNGVADLDGDGDTDGADVTRLRDTLGGVFLWP